MYLSNLKLWNFRKFGSDAEFNPAIPHLNLNFNKGLNVLIGENDSGKSAIIDAIKLVLKTHSPEWITIVSDDFFGATNRLRIECRFDDLTDDEAKNFTEWLGMEGESNNAKPYLKVILDTNKKVDRVLPELIEKLHLSQGTSNRMLAENRIWWGRDGKAVPSVKRFLSEVKEVVTPTTLWLHEDAGHNAEAKNEVRDVLGNLPSETLTPKPTRLIQRILQITTDKDSLVLDSFAGTGTTGHAVLKQNTEDGGNRRFILVEMGYQHRKECYR